MGEAFSLTQTFERLTCANCGIAFAMPSLFVDKRREHHNTFYCPNGHTQYFPAETDAERYKRELDAERERHTRTLNRLNTAERAQRKAEKKLKRVHRGVCPCCNRTFENLARHIATKHPEHAPPPAGKLP